MEEELPCSIVVDGIGTRQVSWICVLATVLFASCRSSPEGSGGAEKLAEESIDVVISVNSPAFAENASIPDEFSCEGSDTSPPLSWNGVPDDAVELALVVDDPDASHGTYVHWVLFTLDPSLTDLEKGDVPADARQAKNSSGAPEYTGPCPPKSDDTHRYRFTVYALRERVTASDGASLADVLTDIRDAATAKGVLTGTFDR